MFWPLNNVLAQFRKECHGRTQLIRMFIEIEMQIAFADGGLKTSEERVVPVQVPPPRLDHPHFRILEVRNDTHEKFGWYDKIRIENRDQFIGAVFEPGL